MKDFIEASVVYDFLTALGVEDVHTVRSAHIDPTHITVYISHDKVHEDGGLLVSDHSVRIQYDDPERVDAVGLSAAIERATALNRLLGQPRDHTDLPNAE